MILGDQRYISKCRGFMQGHKGKSQQQAKLSRSKLKVGTVRKKKIPQSSGLKTKSFLPLISRIKFLPIFYFRRNCATLKNKSGNLFFWQEFTKFCQLLMFFVVFYCSIVRVRNERAMGKTIIKPLMLYKVQILCSLSPFSKPCKKVPSLFMLRNTIAWQK